MTNQHHTTSSQSPDIGQAPSITTTAAIILLTTALACPTTARAEDPPATAPKQHAAKPAKRKPAPRAAVSPGPAAAPAPAAPARNGEAVVSRAWSASSAPPSSAPSAAQAEMAKFAAFDKLSMKGWIMPVPPAAESIFQDANGLRSALAEYGIGYVSYVTTTFAVNALGNAPPTPQTYQGQKPTTNSFAETSISFDLGKIGIEGGQITTGATASLTTWDPLGPNNIKMSNLYYYQSLFSDTVQLQIGLFYNSQNYLGSLVAASLTTGPAAVVPYELGLSRQGMPAPGANVMVNLPGNFYNKAGVQRSLSPEGADVEQQYNPIGLNFSTPDARALYLEEFGYKTSSSPTQGAMWLRAGGLYNTSPSTDFATGLKTDRNWGFYAAADVQISHASPVPYEAYQGYYVGGFYMTSDPNKNFYQTYYEARLYGIGILPGRPFDQTALVFSYTSLSKPGVNAVALATGTTPFSDYAAVTLSNTFRFSPGVYLLLGGSYNIHPSATPRFKDALNVFANLTTVF